MNSVVAIFFHYFVIMFHLREFAGQFPVALLILLSFTRTIFHFSLGKSVWSGKWLVVALC